ncbi:hypothetical protein [Haladaptatus sp. NG-SE-30]
MASTPSTLRNENAIDFQFAATMARRVIAPPVQFLGFWAAVSIPFLYLPLLPGGLPGTELTVFVSLLAFHVAALVIGHGYRR